ncbi:hypothetical protein FA13DRAFT_1798534 [Coprinellus micaceus]|uniref:Uncharacterized protein n=1 Tax=Coprinellus micaceus TaxID=71717 RepID=A0A4Y7SLR2_COPMI|nr:hypothetical protein FA13DRAFT_1798534 [Coprinellus micaceus]
MPRIQRDPTQDEMPDFESEEFTATFTLLVTDQNPLEVIIQSTKDAWTAGHQKRLEEWERQVEADKEEERLQQEEQEREGEENRRAAEELESLRKAEVERKRPKVKGFIAQKQVSTHVAQRPCQYAVNKLRNVEYCEKWYFTPQGCEAARAEDRTVSTSALTLTQGEAGLVLTPAAVHKPSNKVVADEKLSWRDTSIAKGIMLNLIKNERNWPREHVLALITHYMEMDNHPLRVQDHGEEALIIYMAQVYREWIEQVKSTEDHIEPFDIGSTNEERVQAIYRKVLEQKQLSLMVRSVPISSTRKKQSLTSIPSPHLTHTFTHP